MKFAVTSEHHDYFLAHQAIEFEELLTPTQLKQLQDGVLSVLGQRMGGKRALLDKATADEHFIIGRDLWKDSAAIRKIVTHVRLATLAAELVDEKTLRLGYDTYLPAPEIPLSSNDFPDPFHRLLLESTAPFYPLFHPRGGLRTDDLPERLGRKPRKIDSIFSTTRPWRFF